MVYARTRVKTNHSLVVYLGVNVLLVIIALGHQDCKKRKEHWRAISKRCLLEETQMIVKYPQPFLEAPEYWRTSFSKPI